MYELLGVNVNNLSIQDETKCLPSYLASVYTFLVGIGLVFGLPFNTFSCDVMLLLYLQNDTSSDTENNMFESIT